MTNNLVPIGVSDFRLVDKKVIDSVRKLTEYNRFYRGFFAWVGFKSTGVEFERQERKMGAHFPPLPSQVHRLLCFSSKYSWARFRCAFLQQKAMMAKVTAVMKTQPVMVMLRPTVLQNQLLSSQSLEHDPMQYSSQVSLEMHRSRRGHLHTAQPHFSFDFSLPGCRLNHPPPPQRVNEYVSWRRSRLRTYE